MIAWKNLIDKVRPCPIQGSHWFPAVLCKTENCNQESRSWENVFGYMRAAFAQSDDDLTVQL